MIYSFTCSPPDNFSLTTKDRNLGRSLGNCDEIACITYSGHDLGGTTDPLSFTKPAPRITEFAKIKGD